MDDMLSQTHTNSHDSIINVLKMYDVCRKKNENFRFFGEPFLLTSRTIFDDEKFFILRKRVSSGVKSGFNLRLSKQCRILLVDVDRFRI